jgi:hypothetical protein
MYYICVYVCQWWMVYVYYFIVVVSVLNAYFELRMYFWD